MIKIYSLIITLSFCFVQANEHKKISASYDVSYGIFGKLGVANTSVKIDNNNYSIDVLAKATGLAKVLSNGKEERYTSNGSFINNTFIPKTFIKQTKSNSKTKIKKYIFDYKKNKVYVEQTTNKLVYINEGDQSLTNENNINPEIKTKWVKEESSQTLDYFATNDLLSLFFNLKKFIPNFNQGNNYTLKAIGANKNNGNIDILIPTGTEYEELEENLNIDDTKKFIAYINQNIFSSKKGELFISLNDYGICNKAVLKDVLFFGDIVGIMKNFNVEEI